MTEIMRLDFAAPHTPYRNAAGERLPSVTTILGILNKPALLKWAWELGRDGKELERTRQGAADAGTVAHAMAECHLTGRVLDLSNIPPDIVTTAARSFGLFRDWWDASGYEALHTELQMVSERWQVGGTLDILAGKDGRRILLDLKTSKRIYPEMYVQVATYAAMYEEVTGEHVDECYILRIGKEDDATIEIKPVHRRAECVAAFVALHVARRLLHTAGVKV